MPDPMTDEQILTALDLYDQGFTMQEVGERFGKSKGAIVGLFNRIRKDTDAYDQTPHLNGTMPRRWWKR